LWSRGYAPDVTAEREWWLRVPGVLVRPTAVFLALRVTDKDDLDARQEPILLIVLLAGMAGALLTPTIRHAFDPLGIDGVGIDWLTLVVLVFAGGAVTGAGGYFVAGGALYLGARGMGSLGRAQVARHLLAFACVPFALSALLTLPIGLAAFGGDLFRTGGRDSGVAGAFYLAYQLLFVAWSALLLVLGIRAVYGWTWVRAAGALGLLIVFLAGLAAVTNVV
jgi:Yip1-like protein